MDFADVAEFLTRIEATRKRLEIRDLLVELLKATPRDQVGDLAYLLQGALGPPQDGLETGLSVKTILGAIAKASGTEERVLERALIKMGDLGTVAQEAMGTKVQMSLYHEPVTLERVMVGLRQIARIEGTGSQNKKQGTLAELMMAASAEEARYITRAAEGRMRIRVQDITIVQAAAFAFRVTTDDDGEIADWDKLDDDAKVVRKIQVGEVEKAFFLSSDVSYAVRWAAGLEEGEPAIEHGRPIRPMLCERLSSVEAILEKIPEPIWEYKYDGLRVQVHIYGGEVKLFSRRLEELTGSFPDVVAALKKAFKGSSTVVEGECVAVDADGGILPFQLLSQRRGRKEDLERVIGEIPVAVYLFDCFSTDGKVVIDSTTQEREDLLNELFEWDDRVLLSHRTTTGDPEKVNAFFEASLAANCEGLIAKDPAAIYSAGNRGWQWIKLKKDYLEGQADSYDLVIVGADHGEGRRSGWFGAFLMAVRDESGRLETVCKLGTGFTDEMLTEFTEMLKPLIIPVPDASLDVEVDANVWLEPKIVLEVEAAEVTESQRHTAGRQVLGHGLGLRFPRYVGRVRDDKGADQATTSEEVAGIFERQRSRVTDGQGRE